MQNFMQISLRGASRQMGETYAKIFIAVHNYTFFSETHIQVRPFGGFLRDGSNDAVSRKDVPFGN